MGTERTPPRKVKRHFDVLTGAIRMYKVQRYKTNECLKVYDKHQ